MLQERIFLRHTRQRHEKRVHQVAAAPRLPADARDATRLRDVTSCVALRAPISQQAPSSGAALIGPQVPSSGADMNQEGEPPRLRSGADNEAPASSGYGAPVGAPGSGSFFGDRFGGALGGGPFLFRAKACVPRMTSQCCSAPRADRPVPSRSATWSHALSPSSLTNSLRDASSSSAHLPANRRFFAGGSSSRGSSGSGGSSYLRDSISSSHFASMTRAELETSDVSSL